MQRDTMRDPDSTEDDHCGHEEEGLFVNDHGGQNDAGHEKTTPEPLSRAFIGGVNPLTMISLLSDNDWRTVSTHDHGV